MKRSLSRLWMSSDLLQYLGLLTAFVVLVAGHEFAAVHPVLTSVLVFAFSLPYLVASVVSGRAHFLYATMLLGAVSYFLACHALGAPGTSFPLLSVPLVVALLIVGHALRRKLPAAKAAYPATVFRAMSITVAVFAGWALVQAGDTMSQAGLIRHVAGLAFLGFAGLYLAHSLAGAPALYVYVFAGCLTLGGTLTVASVWSFDFCWIPAIVGAGVVLAVGTKCHGGRGYRWAKHFYLAAGVVIFISLVLAMVRGSFLLVDLALGSLVLWAAYRSLAGALPDVRHAMLAERVVAKCFFYGSLFFSALVAPMLFLWPTDPYVAAAALLCSVTLWWIAWQRRDEVYGARGIYVLSAALFASAGLLGLGRMLPMTFAPAWSFVGLAALLGGLALLARPAGESGRGAFGSSAPSAAVFPAFFAWFIPILLGEYVIALAAAGAAAFAVAVLAAIRKERNYLYAFGPALAGAFVAGAVLLGGGGVPSWAACAVAAVVAGACFLLAGARGRVVTRGAASLAWLVLSVAAICLARGGQAVELLWSITAGGFTAIVMTGLPASAHRRDVFARLAFVGAVLAGCAAIVCGPISDIAGAWAGTSLLILSAACWMVWPRCRALWCVRAGAGLLALGAMLVIFGELTAPGARLAAGAGVVAVLFVLASATRARAAGASRIAAGVGHMTSIVLALAVLVQAWPAATWNLALSAGALAVLYAFMPRLWRGLRFRMGAVLWACAAVVFSLSAWAGTPYWQQMPLAVYLTLLCVGAGYALAGGGRRRAQEAEACTESADAWSTALYAAGAVFAIFCGVVSLFVGLRGSEAQAGGAWQVLLVIGVAFALLFLILRQDLFVYLLTLSLSLMAYNWVKASTSYFTKDALFYLIVGTGLLGMFFLLPRLKRLLVRGGSLPLFSIFAPRGELLMAVPVVGLALLLVSAYSLKLTGHPRFCTSCHNMGGFYASWQHSSHKNVACIDCHYEPGASAMMKGKLEGLVQVVKYVSHSYSTKPHALITNNSCMRPGCHSDMDHQKQTVLFHQKIKFRHEKHLTGMPRGKTLNCVSCHGHAVENEHISVTKTTCITCHFYERKDGPVAAGGCLTCHDLPSKPMAFKGGSFDHRKFLANNPRAHCEQCHSQVTQGTGAVSATRCRSCHVNRSLKEVGDQVEFHLVHVSKGHFDCLQCHDEIKHGSRPLEKQLLAAGNCNACHSGDRHSIQELMYAGTAIPGVAPLPDPMYKAGVSCGGCHTEVRSGGFGAMPFTKKLSGAKQCVDCHHGKKKYGETLTEGREYIKEMLGDLGSRATKLDKVLASAEAPAEQLAQAKKQLGAVKLALSYLDQDGSLGAHNLSYAMSALEYLESEINKCQSLASKWKKPAAGGTP